jgi:hypothetical protein
MGNVLTLKGLQEAPISPLMSRFSRMHGIHYHIWAPPESAVRIEYSTDVLGELRGLSANGDAGGVLFGMRHGNDIRVLAAIPLPVGPDSRPPGLDPVGIFVARVRGEVFLTESDLERLESAGGVALVVAGWKAGFFVWEPDGSIQAIRSYREFPLPGAPKAEPVLPVSAKTRLAEWAWILLGCLSLAAIGAIAGHHLRRPASPPPLGLTVKNVQGQLRIAWSPVLPGEKVPGENGSLEIGTLEIIDGAQHTVIPVPATLVNTTYAPGSGDVEIFLTRGGRRATARMIGSGPAPSPEVESARLDIANLEAETGALKGAIQRNRARAAELQTLLDRNLQSASK